MRLNLRGQAIGRGHIDGLALPGPIGTDYCWLTDDTPICAQGATIERFDGAIVDGAWRGTWSVVEPHGANWLRAGKGRRFSFWSGSTDDLAPADVDPYVGTAVLTRYSTGSDVVLRETDGRETVVRTGPLGTDALAFRNARQRAGWLLWQSQATGTWTLRLAPDGADIPIAPRAEAVDYAVPVAIGGKVLLLERANGRLSLRWPDSTAGWIVHEDGASDGLAAPDAIAVGGIVRVSWSDRQSESAAVFRATDVELDPAALVDLNHAAPLPEPHVEPYHRPIPHFAYFTLDADRGYGDHYEQILHACWCATASDVAKANEHDVPVIAAAAFIEHAEQPVMVMCANDYAGAPPLDRQIADALPIAMRLQIGMLVMDEDDWQIFPPHLPPRAICGFKAFREPRESLEAYQQRIFEIAARVVTTGRKVCLILGCDDRLNTITEATLVETLQLMTEYLAELGDVVMIGVFSYARAKRFDDGTVTGGGLVHPIAWRWVRASAAASDAVEWSAYQLEQQPEHPEVPHMMYLPGPPTSTTGVSTTVVLGTKVPQSDGSFAIKKPNGKWLTLNPQGQWEERDGGPENVREWEKYWPNKAGGGTLAPNRDGKTFWIQTLED